MYKTGKTNPGCFAHTGQVHVPGSKGNQVTGNNSAENGNQTKQPAPLDRDEHSYSQ